MTILRLALFALAGLTLAGCDNAGSALKSAAGDAAREATRTASGLVSLRTACIAAGQNAAFCGCVDQRLGDKLSPAQMRGVADVMVETVKSGSVQEAARNAKALPPETRTVLVQCAARAAVQGAVSEATGG